MGNSVSMLERRKYSLDALLELADLEGRPLAPILALEEMMNSREGEPFDEDRYVEMSKIEANETAAIEILSAFLPG